MNKSVQQRLFVKLIGKLIEWAYDNGYELTFGEAWRTPQQAAWNAVAGKGITHSLHIDRLAIDFNLWINGVYITDPVRYKPLGNYWKTLNALACWGGDFKTVDANHFSLSYNDIK